MIEINFLTMECRVLLEDQITHFKALEAWLASSEQATLFELFRENLSPIVHYFSHRSVLEVGHFYPSFCLNNDTKEFTSVMPYLHLNSNIIADPLHLPIERDSFDCIFMPLTFDLFPKIQMIFDEVDRVLKPFGSLILIGIHPMSRLGLKLRFFPEGLKCYKRSPSSISRLLYQHGYEKEHFWRFSRTAQSRKYERLLPNDFYGLVFRKYQEAPPDFRVAWEVSRRKTEMTEVMAYSP